METCHLLASLWGDATVPADYAITVMTNPEKKRLEANLTPV